MLGPRHDQGRRNGVGVVRVSTPGQVDNYGPAAQRDDIIRRAQELGVHLLETIEFQESATNSLNRPKFEVLLENLARRGQAKELQVVILGQSDRLGRDGPVAFMHYNFILRQVGLEIRYGRDDVDPDAEFGEIILALQAFKAQQDAKTIRANTMGGRNRRGKDGKLPTGEVCYGFCYVSKRQAGQASTGRPSINQEQAEHIRMWANWVLEDRVSLKEVSRRMEASGVLSPRGSLRWSQSTISRILQNRALVGEFRRWENGEEILVIQDPELAILTLEQFQAIQNIFQRNRELARRNTNQDYSPLQRLVSCQCGRKAGAHFRTYPYFRCNHCRGKNWNALKLWEEVKKTLTVMVSNVGALADIIESRVSSPDMREQQEAKAARLEIEVADLEEAQERAVRMGIWLKNYPAEKVQDEVDRTHEKLGYKRAELEAVMAAMVGLERAEDEAQRIEAIGESFRKRLENASDADWRRFLLDLGVKVILQPEGPHLLCAIVNLPPPMGVQSFITSHDWALQNALLQS